MVLGKPVSGQRAAREPLFDVHPQTGAAMRRSAGAAGWFWCQRGCSPAGPATGPFATSYSAYRHAIVTAARSSLGDAWRGDRWPTTLMRTQCGHEISLKGEIHAKSLKGLVGAPGLEPGTR